MVFFNYATMQMAAKIVYYGPGLCGKTTNLHHIYSKTSPGSRGEMVSLETETDRTLFFDLLPIDVGVIGGFKTRLQLYTVPGQVFYNTTRKLVLKGVDGIVFVADSQQAMQEANLDSFRNLRENLAEIGTNVDEIPLVIQLNKRDLPNIASPEAMLDLLDPDRRAEHVEAIAFNGVGVFETLKLISKLTLRTLRRRMTGDDSPPPVKAVQFRVQDHHRPAGLAAALARSNEEAQASASASASLGTTITEELEEVEELSASTRIEAEPETIQQQEAAAANAPTIEAHDAEPDVEPESAHYAPPPAAEPEIAFPAAEEKPQTQEPAVKTVKVRSSVDIMAELEALRKRATQGTAKPAKRDVLADLDNLRPRRDITRSLQLDVSADLLARASSLRVTLAFEDGEAGVIETREQQLELGDASGAQSLSVNLKIDLT